MLEFVTVLRVFYSCFMCSAPSVRPAIRRVQAGTEPLLALNNENAAHLSFLTLEEFERLINEAFYAAAINDADALLLAFDPSANYDSPNFLWFKERYDKFVYVDRIVTAPSARGKGYARALYADLFDRTKAAGQMRVVCEVNFEPPNPVSDAFHKALGFYEVGRGSVPYQGGRKTVRYLLRSL